jgi:hypothetical protein
MNQNIPPRKWWLNHRHDRKHTRRNRGSRSQQYIETLAEQVALDFPEQNEAAAAHISTSGITLTGGIHLGDPDPAESERNGRSHTAGSAKSKQRRSEKLYAKHKKLPTDEPDTWR